MRFDILTLFPELITTVLASSILGRAQSSGAIEVYAHNIRDYSQDKHRRVDDTPYGGGKGMLMAAPPIYRCIEAVKAMQESAVRRRVVYLSPCGAVFDQRKAEAFSAYDNLILLCGHYEGVDARVLELCIDEEVSVGNFVLTGGELPACMIADAVARLLPGVLAAPECFEKESFSDGLLEYPQYTRPYEFMGKTVPEVLLSGHHENIEKWRFMQSVEITRKKRPDLYSIWEKGKR